jgi:hypothetical protein
VIISWETDVMDERIDQSRRRFLGATAMTLAGAPSGGTPVRFKVSLDGQPPGAARGGNVDATAFTFG